MRKLTFTILIAAGLSTASGAAPAQPSAQQGTAGHHQAPVPHNAMRLSNLVNPADKIIELALKGFEAGVDAEGRKNPEQAAVYNANPGLLEAVSNAGRPIILKHLKAAIPGQQQRYARFYAENFSADEIDEMASFYASATGRKVINAVYSGVKLDQLIEKAGLRKDGNLTAADTDEVRNAALKDLPDQFNADDWKALFVFAATPVYAKMVKLAPEFSRLIAEVNNEPDPAMDAEIDQAVQAAVHAYIAKRNGKS